MVLIHEKCSELHIISVKVWACKIKDKKFLNLNIFLYNKVGLALQIITVKITGFNCWSN